MKKVISVLGCILVVLLALLPLGTWISACFGYTFQMTSIFVHSVVASFLSVCLVVFSIKVKEPSECGAIKVLFAFLLPLSFVHGLFCLFESSRIWIAVCGLICIACCAYLTEKHTEPLAVKVTALALSAILALPTAYLGFIALIFGDVRQETVVRSVASPSGAYYAEIIDSDQGALGGDTLVDVYENGGLNALAFRITKKPKRVYQGAWGEYRSMEIYWKNDRCLVINAVEYEIE